MGEKAKMRAVEYEIATPTFGRLAMTEGGSWLAMTGGRSGWKCREKTKAKMWV